MTKNIILESALTTDTSISCKNLNTTEFVACLQSCDVKNRNGRIYSKKLLEDAINSPYIRERLSTKTLFCEIGHPLDTSVQRQMTIDQRNVACVIKELWFEGNLLKGRLETLNTTLGRDLQGLIEQGCKIAFSLRAQGNVHADPNGTIIVESPLQICTWDVVITPSHAEAYMEKICEETIRAMYKTNKAGLTSKILCESEDLFNNGLIIDPNDVVEPEELDYTKNYTPKFKPAEDMYTPEPEDKVISMSESIVLIRNDKRNVIKKVLTEDYLVKDFRRRLVEEG